MMYFSTYENRRYWDQKIRGCGKTQFLFEKIRYFWNYVEYGRDSKLRTLAPSPYRGGGLIQIDILNIENEDPGTSVMEIKSLGSLASFQFKFNITQKNLEKFLFLQILILTAFLVIITQRLQLFGSPLPLFFSSLYSSINFSL